LSDGGQEFLFVFQQHGLRDLQLQSVGLQSGLDKRAQDDVEKVAALELNRRQIDGDDYVIRPGSAESILSTG
jgi:hypothetical protein